MLQYKSVLNDEKGWEGAKNNPKTLMTLFMEAP